MIPSGAVGAARWLAGVLSLCLFACPAGAVSFPASTVVHAAQPDLPAVARGVPMGGALRVWGVQIEGSTADGLDLARFAVFTSDARIQLNEGPSLAPPDTAYFRGRVEGEPESIAVLSLTANGTLEGMILSQGNWWMMEPQKPAGAQGIKARKLGAADLEALKEFRCALEGSALTGETLVNGEGSALTPDLAGVPVSYAARIAVETDAEYYAHFGNTDAATQYAGNLFAYASSIYEREIGTSLNLSYLRLWTTGAANDPWTVTSDTSAALTEFLNYWRANMAGQDRTLAHMLSGKALGGGIAYIGALCDKSYGYGLSASLSYGYAPGVTRTVWDTLVITHEIGHNFNSPHTHSYCNVRGDSRPVDECAPAAYGGACNGVSGALPFGCAGSSQGCGTIMSYCHLISGGYGNISMTFGTGHPYGVLPDRVPQQMMAHVQNRAQAYPACLAPVVEGPQLSVTKTGTGSGTITSADGGINCGTDCSQNYLTGTAVTLSATPAAGSSFSGWGGACAGTGPTCSLTMDAAKAASAGFAPLPVTHLHIGDLDSASTLGTKGRWNAILRVRVHSSAEAPVAGVTVSGTWSAGTTGSGSCVTDSVGECTLTKANLKGTLSSVGFSVANATATGFSYNAQANHDPDGDSTGTAIVLGKP